MENLKKNLQKYYFN